MVKIKKEVVDALKVKLDDIQYEQSLDKNNIRLIVRVVFCSDEEFFYVFNIVKDDKVLKKVVANNTREYDKIYKDLVIEYNTNIEHKYDDLNSNQLDYLNNIDIDSTRVSIDEVNKRKSIMFLDNLEHFMY